MANRVPFTAYFKIVPERGSGKRFEIHRGRERIAYLVYNDLTTNFAGNLAAPGGSATWTLAADEYALSSNVDAAALKPQFGENPDQLTIVGFYDAEPSIPYRLVSIIHAGRTVRGPATGAPGWNFAAEASDANAALAKDLKSALEAAITSVPVELIRLEVCGVAYGRGARHFPL